jgi:hypothetical protein
MLPTIKHYGFDFPPLGIIDILKQFDFDQPTTFYILDPFMGVELPYEEVATDRTNRFVVITTHEGASHRWFDRLIPRLNSCGVDNQHIIIRSACLWDPDSPVKRINTIVDECTDYVSKCQHIDNVIGQDPTHHFVCLNMMHRWQRHCLVKELLQKGLDRYGKISYVQPAPGEQSRVIDLDHVNWSQGHDISHPAMQGALFNVITESAYEPEPGTTHIENHYRPGMTEKSFKCFIMAQIPIWLAPYRAVECYRQLGFDVFDDVINHSYDLEKCPSTRISMVADQVEKICQLTLSELKQQLVPRFEKNLQCLRSFVMNLHSEMPQWRAALAI